MSGVEVVAAVSAVISAFHGGSELLKHIKAKRRRTRQALKEFEERQLQDSLVSGEQQIGLRYAQDMREFGDLMRVGDVIARNRLQHITIMMQGEVIKSLQMAAQYDNAILNLTLLHEASITNRSDTIVTLDELKQRLSIRRPVPRQLEGVSEPFSDRTSIAGVSSAFTTVPDNNMPAAVTIPSNDDNMKDSKHTLTNYFRLKRNSSASSASLSSPPPDINFSPAFEQLARARGAEDRAIIMQDIDHIIDSYQNLHMDDGPRSSWGSNQWHRDAVKREPSTRYFRLASLPGQDSAQMPHNLPPTAQEYGNSDYQSYPTFNSSMPDPHQAQQTYGQPPIARNPFPQLQTQDARSRLSAASGSSSVYSDTPSLNRNSSTSSQDSQTQSPMPLNFPTRNVCTSNTNYSPPSNARYQNESVNTVHTSPFASAERSYPKPIAPLSPQRSRGPSNASPTQSLQTPYSPSIGTEDRNSLQYSPYATPSLPAHSYTGSPIAEPSQQRTSLQEQRNAEATLNRPKYHLLPNTARDTSSMKSNQSDRTISQSLMSATTLGTAPATAGLRHASIAPSVASTDSSTSGSIGILPDARNRIIRTGTVQSGGSEKMMDGRPCKANNYWGFCKGSWTIREDVKKGLALRTLPSGMYNTKEIWECSECSFKGATFSAPHPTKKNKTLTVVDPRIVTSQSGIRFRWVFLAKSHVKKPRADSHTEESNYGCVLCSVEDNVSSIYGGVETLMNHIALCHVAGMSEKTRRKVNCVIGRVAGDKEEWDLNIPIFGELAGDQPAMI